MARGGGRAYSALIGRYITRNFGARGVRVYREVSLGKSIIGKTRRVDLLVLDEQSARGLALECKFQAVQGTADEKVPYTIQDLRAMRLPACVVYAGSGFSEGILHMLRASDMAAYCSPDGRNPRRTARTIELDHILAMEFGWWDIVVREKQLILP